MPLYVLIDGNEYEATRCGLKKWLALEDIKTELFQATGDTFADKLLAYLSVAFDVNTDELENLAWYEIADAYIDVNSLNNLDFEFPLLREQIKKDVAPWEYNGRTWYLWANLFANAYGWKLDYIAELDPNDAIALLQEILVDDQIEKEWQWGLSEMAYPYDSNTKKSKYQPLPRPAWMQKELKQPPKKVKLPVSMLPMGVIYKSPTENADETT